MIIDAIMCPHCGKIPGRSKPPPPPAPGGRSAAPRALGIVAGIGSLTLIAAGVARRETTLVLAGAAVLVFALGFLVLARRQ